MASGSFFWPHPRRRLEGASNMLRPPAPHAADQYGPKQHSNLVASGDAFWTQQFLDGAAIRAPPLELRLLGGRVDARIAGELDVSYH